MQRVNVLQSSNRPLAIGLRKEKVFGYNKLERQYGLLLILIFSTLFLVITLVIIFNKFSHSNDTINYLNTKLENTKFLTNSYIDTISKSIPYYNQTGSK